jgi:hypothetical protein
VTQLGGGLSCGAPAAGAPDRLKVYYRRLARPPAARPAGALSPTYYRTRGVTNFGCLPTCRNKVAVKLKYLPTCRQSRWASTQPPCVVPALPATLHPNASAPLPAEGRDAPYHAPVAPWLACGAPRHAAVSKHARGRKASVAPNASKFRTTAFPHALLPTAVFRHRFHLCRGRWGGRCRCCEHPGRAAPKDDGHRNKKESDLILLRNCGAANRAAISAHFLAAAPLRPRRDAHGPQRQHQRVHGDAHGSALHLPPWPPYVAHGNCRAWPP